MSRENVARFHEATAAFNRGDLDAWLEFYDEGCVFEPQISAVEGIYTGHVGIREFTRSIGDQYEAFQVELEDVRDLGEGVLALGIGVARGRRSGIEQRQPLAIIARFKDGRIIHFKDFGDKDQALEAAGLAE